MFDLSAEQLAIVLAIVVLVFGTRRLSHLRPRRDASRHLEEDLRRRMPVFSAETTGGKEAEFIRDRLPKRFPYFVLFIAAALVVGAIMWWLKR